MAFMKFATTLTVIGLLACLQSAASAQDGGKKHGKRHEALLKKFDKDGDGKLDKQERHAAREFVKSRRAEGGKEGRHAKHALRRARILKRFDKDHDGKLNNQERAAAREFLKSRHHHRAK